MTDEDGGIVLADIKTTYDKHYEKVALQLSIYKRFFERQNPGSFKRFTICTIYSFYTVIY